MSKTQIKRFQRSYLSPNTPISTQTYLPLLSQLRQVSQQRSFEVKNSIFSTEVKNSNILNRIIELEAVVEMERYERMRDCDRMKNMIREMECKHSSIIYNSEIRYCKSPPKPDIFFATNQKSKENTLVKSSSASTLRLQKENLVDLNQRANRAIIDRCTQKVGNTQQINYLNQCGKGYQNPQKSVELLTKNQSTKHHLNSDFVKKLTDEIESKIEDNFNKKLDIFRKELSTKIKMNQQYLDQNLLKYETKQQNSLTNINKTIDNFRVSIREQNLSNELVYSQKLKQFAGKIKELVFQMNSQVEGKLQKIEQTFASFKQPFNTMLEGICESISEQNVQIKKLDDFSQLNHNIYTNKIRQTMQFLNNKLSFYEKQQRQRNQKQIQELQVEKQRRQQAIMKNIEQKINNKSDISKIGLEKVLSDRCQRIEEVLQGTIQRHIHYVEDYIRKNIEKQNIIMKSYNIIYHDHN